MTTRSALITATVGILLAGKAAFTQDSKPGLVAKYSDAKGSVTRVVPLPDFRLRSVESIHPQIDRSFEAEWTGLLKIDRAGRYRVHADNAAVQLSGKNSEAVILATGEHPIHIRFNQTDGADRLELRWESEFFRDEPVPSSVLRHRGDVPELAEQDSIEHGRFLFAELGCANCHAASDWRLQARRGPDLADAGSRINAGWLYEWLKDPHQYRKAAVMPVCLESEQDRADVTAFVMSLKNVSAVADDSDVNAALIERGKALFNQVGCVKCHDRENSLTLVRSKYLTVGKLGQFIANPHTTDPHGRMPQVFNPASEQHLASAVAQYLFSQTSTLYEAPPDGDVQRGMKLFAATGCASCHAVSGSGINKADVLAGLPFGKPVGLPLRHYWDFGTETSPAVKDVVSGRSEKVVGRTAFEASATGQGSAFRFDGNAFIEVQHFHRPDTMTISVWVNTTRGGSIITWGRPGGGQRGSRELRMNIGQDGKNSVCYGEYNSDGGWKPVIVRPPDINLTDGKWHHIALVRKGESVQHYIDGKAQGGGKVQKGGGDYTDRLLIGALGLSGNPTNRFNGLIDGLSVWEMALNGQQIAMLAGGKSPLTMARPPQQDVRPFDVAAGCLADDVKRPLPDYRLGVSDQVALRGFLRTVQPGEKTVYHAAPLTIHDLRIQQFRCTKCHELNDQNIQKAVAVDENGRVVRVERPPLLTGAGAKLTSEWLGQVLLERKRNRPWLGLRMPHFGEAVSDLPELISSVAGVSAEDSGPTPDRSLAAAGMDMIGVRRGKVACIACHDYRGINRRKDGVVPAPDIAEAGRTVRRDWFERWIDDPQRLQPGTSMPQLFRDLSAEERNLQTARLWSALHHQKDLPLPKGVLDQQTEGTRIVVNDKPVIFRMSTVTPVGQIDRAINVGIPGGLNFTFDPVSCRLRYVWKGEFLDAGPAWNGRGGNPVRAGSEKLLGIKDGHSIRIGDETKAGTLRFLGYRLENHLPVFRYVVDSAIVEHRVTVTTTHVGQAVVVKRPNGDVYYVGDGETAFTSESGQREGNVIRFDKAGIVEFVILTPTGNTSGN